MARELPQVQGHPRDEVRNVLGVLALDQVGGHHPLSEACLGTAGRRILQALADGETDPDRLAELGDDRLHCSELELADASPELVGKGHVL